MAGGLRTIRIRFLGDTKGLNQAAKSGEQQLSKWQKGFQKLDRVATGVLVGLGGAIAGAVTKVASMGDEIASTAPKLGIGVEALQEMRYWAEQNGIETGQLDRAVGRLNQRIGRAAAGNDKYAAAFENLGISLTDQEGNFRDTEEVMRDTIASLQNIQDPAEQSAAAAEVFGTKMARDLMPALQDGSMSLDDAAKKAHDLGLVMDGESVDSAAQFQTALNDLKDAGTGLMIEFGIPFLEFLTEQVVPVVQEQVMPALSKFGNWFRDHQEVVLTITGALMGLAGAIKAVSVAQKVLNTVMKANPIMRIISIIFLLVDAFIALWNRSESFRNFWKGLWDSVVSIAKGAVNGAISAVNGIIWGLNKLVDGANLLPGVNIPHIPEIPKLERGGIAHADRTYLVGEAGPELFTPGQTGRVTPNHELGTGGDTYVRVYIGDRDITDIVDTRIDENTRRAQRTLVARTGGVFA